MQFVTWLRIAFYPDHEVDVKRLGHWPVKELGSIGFVGLETIRCDRKATW
jgi:hypothetical protein